ncbi:MAG: tetratricopeptide repeat protein [Melioribacteraceae bacterium]|nr:tetratricopeptide repeat protein [Melioribacteraceae bacterium]MCF8353058.1 tetratricopeptide repeat protein [Melioribacteraceae bacterium]MCF8392796.1 tetratricopeptide repeat protein [Melioribacteraceae bacterium]MCF8418327.1 tetratricopeptide repeat protein [Melioribacteraceae bacterium]
MRRLVILLSLTAMVFGIVAFQCSSTEITSAKLYIQQKNLPKAEEVLLKEIEKNPQSDEGYYLLGFVYGEQGKIKKMIESFDKSLAISNKFEQNIIDSKKYHWAQGFNKGVALFNKASQQQNEDSTIVFFDKAIETFENAILCQPDSADTYKNLAYAYMNKGDYESAIIPLEKLIEIEKKKGPGSFIGSSEGRIISCLGEPDSKSITAYKGLPEAKLYSYNNLGLEIFVSEGKIVGYTILDEKKIDSDMFPCIASNIADVYLRLGEIYIDKGQLEMNKYKISGVAKDSVTAMKYYNKAVGILEEARSSYPEDGDILLLLSNAYIASNKIDIAMDAFKAGVEKEPDNKYYRYNYAYLLLGDEQFEAAAEQFEAAVRLDPEYLNAIYNLAATYVKWGAAIREANIEDENNTEYLEKFKLALPHLEKYVELEPDDAPVWELLGKVYANLGMETESMDAFDRADTLR